MDFQQASEKDNTVLVIGGGVAGIKASLDLAEMGRNVVLVDKAPAIGGLMTQLDRTFPTNNCDMCTISPHLAESNRELHIELLTMTQVEKVEGEAGGFEVTTKSDPRYIDIDKCTACGECHKRFPEAVRFTPGLDARAPTCMRYPQATPYAFSIDIDKVEDRQALTDVCPAGAIDLNQTESFSTLNIGSIIVAGGAELFNADLLTNYGHGVFPNVVTGLEYERILSASGPTNGALVRPSDGKQPKKIAWIQCAGSRNTTAGARSYCSSVCCMYALKEAIVTKERFQDDIEATIFYMDMRTFGKDYEIYLQRAKEDFGVRFVRIRPHTVEQAPNSTDLEINYTDDATSQPMMDQFDMVVLSTGFCSSPQLQELAGKLGVDLNAHDFVQTSTFQPVATSKKGVYVCGLVEAPKDVPETIIQASAAACEAANDLKMRTVAPEAPAEDYPPERDVAGEEPKTGVFICDCGFNIGGVIDVQNIAEYARMLPHVKVAEVVGHGCSKESIEHIQKNIKENGLNRVVMGACSPRTHEIVFQDMIRSVGLNKYLVEIANLRDQDSWVHHDNPAVATDKAKDLLRMAVASAEISHPLTDHTLPVNKNALVVGGGVAGMSSALGLADQGFKVYLVEQTRDLGGLAKLIRKTIHGEDVQAQVAELADKVKAHEQIEVLTNTIVVDHTGIPGRFTTGVQVGPHMYYRQIEHGVTILATGAMPNRPREYLLGQNPAVMTQLDLDGMLEDDAAKIKTWENVVMIQCVGSRVPENPNCSRVCCQSAVKNALRIKEENPEAQIYILYRDMRMYGFLEDYYLKAREKGVIFIRYSVDEKPQVASDGDKLSVVFREPLLNRNLSIAADALVLSTGMVADDEMSEDMAMIFHLPRTHDGYFLEDHVKLRPVDLSVPGFFVAGTAHAPKNIGESITHGLAAAARAETLLRTDVINLGAVIARVDTTRCASCLICVRACPFEVPFINADGVSEIDPAECRGCGICAAECPAKAIQLLQFEDDQIMAKVEGLLEGIM